MKKLLIIALSIFPASAILAQKAPKLSEQKKIELVPKKDKYDLNKILVIPKHADTTKQKELLDQLQTLRRQNSASLSHRTSSGRVYQMKPDNMPCLVPNMDQLATMPVKPMPGSPGVMPNPLKRGETVPKKE